jgi:hypothetical protein
MATDPKTLEYRKIHNLCPRDGRPNKSGRKMCEYCLGKSVEKTQRHNKKKKANGLCLCCGKPSDGQRLCDVCRPKAIVASNKSQMKHYNKCKDANICVICSNSVDNNKTLCSKCSDDKNTYQKKRHDLFIALNMCYDCGKNPPVENGKRCQICIDKRNNWYQGSLTQTKDKVRRDNNRNTVIKYYGGKCVECGESKSVCLAIDHIDGDGNTHRHKIGKYGSGFFKWLMDNNFPEGFQILCHNCNMSKYLNGGI